MKLSDKISTLRKKNGMSQEDLAEKLNVSRQAISRWEMGSAMPDANNILQISKLFGVTADYLLNEDYVSDNDVPKVKEVKEDNTRIIMVSLITLEVMILIIQFMSVFILQSAVFGILSFVPFVACIGGFEFGYQKRANEHSEKTRKFRKQFYEISAWLGTYFPVRLLAYMAKSFYPRPYSVIAFECVVASVYLATALIITLNIESRFRKANRGDAFSE